MPCDVAERPDERLARVVDVRPHQPVRVLCAALLDGLEDPGVAGCGDRRAARLPKGQIPEVRDLGVDLLEQDIEPRTPGASVNGVMEAVRLHDRDRFPREARGSDRRLLLLEQDRAQLLDLLVRHALRGKGRGGRLESPPNAIDVLDLFGRDRRDVDSIVRANLEQPILLETADGFPDGVPADAERLGYRPFVDALSGQVDTVKQGSAERLIRPLLEGLLVREQGQARTGWCV